VSSPCTRVLLHRKLSVIAPHSNRPLARGRGDPTLNTVRLIANPARRRVDHGSEPQFPSWPRKTQRLYTHLACPRRRETILIWSAPSGLRSAPAQPVIAPDSTPTFATPLLPQPLVEWSPTRNRIGAQRATCCFRAPSPLTYAQNSALWGIVC
jgi:hypothetical protein